MQHLIFNPDEAPRVEDIPVLADFTGELVELINCNWRLLALFAVGQGRGELYAVLAGDGQFCALRSGSVAEFDSIARLCPQAQLFEREIYENSGIMPRHHPWLKSVRIIPDAPGKSRNADYGFYRVQGGQAHEVGVGPIHAGIIEPGHFRFQCYGENVLNLEIALGYQHRGVERMLLELPAASTANHLRLRLVECVAGDESVANATAQCVLWERMFGLGALDEHTQRMRRIGLELERLACHCGDLGAIAGDTGYLPTSSWNGRIRGDFLNMTAAICGNRFGREFVHPGGVDNDLDPEQCGMLLEKLASCGRDALASSEAMFESASVRDRMEGTGVIDTALALELGLVGVAARASGVECDARFNFPLSSLPMYGASLRKAAGGDVMARAMVRFLEMKDSLELVRNDLEWLAANPRNGTRGQQMKLPGGRLGVALVESWRGEVCHVGLTGADGEFLACKIVDPSFHNWIGLSLAMRNGQISDFPLCNKSFNLSYCGHDQ